MRSTLSGRKSSINPSRLPTFDRGEKSLASSEPRVSNLTKPKSQTTNTESQIPRSRITSSSSSDRGSIRRSNLKSISGASKVSGNGAHHQLTTPRTPHVQPTKFAPDLPSGSRGRSPSAERASEIKTNPGPKKDTRPLNDKNFQTEMLMRIDSFFENVNQQSLLNANGSLKPISLKIFVAVTDFLLKFLDFKLSLNSNNYMEELPKIAKKLEYPGVVAKSWLKTANTMHSWPHVLGWLSWLVEICEANDIADQQFQLTSTPCIDSIDEGAINRNQLIQLLQMYKVWNEGKDEKVKELSNEYVQSIADGCGFRVEDLQEAEEEFEKNQKKYDEVDKADQDIQEEINVTLSKLEALKLDRSKQIMYMEEMDKFLSKTEIDIQNLNKETAILEKLEKKNLQMQQELNDAIAQQIITPQERDAILKQCTDMVNYINQFDIHIEELQKEIWTDDLKHSHIIEKLSEAIFAYNRDVVINVIPDAKDLQLPESSLNDKNYKNYLDEKIEAMKRLKEVLKKQLNNHKSIINTHMEELETLQDKLKIQEQKREAWFSKNHEKKMLLNNIKSNMKEEEEKLIATINKYETEISLAKSQFPDLEKIKYEVTENKEKLEAVERRKTFLEQSSKRLFQRFYELVNSDKRELHKIAESLRKIEI
ncbi:kinetochore protein NDC80 homolog [Chelonus insularis]|uniref:kinetochore protein NDC80 homolog n=1 Tax=Chelonus insularis TaxID=460826 RepID=UPI00158B68A1|nr:kinetochore protein NDC80 homolog [Chelonus insularis]